MAATALVNKDKSHCPKCMRDELDQCEVIIKRSGGMESEGQKPQVICKSCKNADGRMMRIGDIDVKVIGELDDPDRSKMYLEAHSLFGDKLAKLVTDTLEKMHVRRKTRSLRTSENLMDEEDVRENFKHKPWKIEAILANDEGVIECPILKCKLYPVPEYVRETLAEDIVQEKRLREVETEERVKKVAKRKPAPKPVGDDTAGVGEEPPQQVPKPIASEKIGSMSRAVTKLDETHLELAGAIMEGKAPEFKEHVPNLQLQKAEAAAQLVTELAALGREFESKKTATKLELAKFAGATAAINNANDVNKQLNDLIEDAKNASSS